MSGSVNKKWCEKEKAEKDVCVIQKREIDATATSWLGFVVRNTSADGHFSHGGQQDGRRRR